MKISLLKFVFCLLLLQFSGIAAQAQVVDWVGKTQASFPNSGFFNNSQSLSKVTHDAAGNSYYFGTVTDSVTIGTTTLYQSGSSAGFIAKVSPGGTVLYAKKIITPTIINALSMEANQAGEIYIAASFTGTVVLDDTTLVNPSSTQRMLFISKFTTAGARVWTRIASGTGSIINTQMVIDQTGNLCLSGEYQGSINFFGTAISTASANMKFVGKVSGNGTAQWVKSDILASFASGFTLDVDNAGNVYYLSRMINGSLTTCNLSISNPGTFGMAITKLSPGGACLWTQFADSIMGVGDITVDGDGNCYFAALLGQQPASFGNYTLPGASTNVDPFFNPLAPFLVKYSPAGNVEWAKRGGEVYPGGNTDIESDGAGNVFMVVNESWCNCPNLNTTFYDGNIINLDQSKEISVLLNYSPAGDVNWIRTSRGTGISQVLIGDISVDNDGTLYAAGSWICDQMNCFAFTIDVNIAEQFSFSTDRSGSFFFKLLETASVITGRVFIDSNSNGLMDTTETAAPQIMIGVEPGGSYASSAPDGFYSDFVGTGNFTITVPQPPLYHAPSPVSHSASFSALGQTDTGNDFGFAPIPNQQDLDLSITPLQPPRPGFPVSYRITYHNPGTMAIASGDVSFTFDALYTFLSSSQPASQTGNTLTWNFSNLQPGQTSHINVLLSLTALAPLGDSVTCSATVSPLAGDLTPANNTETSVREIVGSYDPNSIEVNYQELTTDQLQSGQNLNYTIRFQNLGTDTAFTVVLVDTLPGQMLNLGSIQFLSSSHSCSWGLNQHGRLVVNFPGIKLPHQGINSIGSNGFVRFRIKPFANLPIGHIIPNKAGIYFDYNQPVITNEATTEIVQPSGIGADNNLGWRIFPNPASQNLSFESDKTLSGPVEIILANVLGQQVLKTGAPAGNGVFRHELNLEKLPKGMYLLQIKTGMGTVSKSVIKQ